MSEYGGVSWPPPIAAIPGRDDAPVSQDALRRLREQRAATAQAIAESLYQMVMRGQMRDPAVVAACRPLYEMTQQIARMEAALGTSGAGPLSAAGSYGDVVAPTPAGQRPAWQVEPAGVGAAPSAAARGALAADRVCSHCQMPLKATDHACPVCGRDTADAVSPAAASAPVRMASSPTHTHCHRCSTSLRPQDRVCPVCGSAQTT